MKGGFTNYGEAIGILMLETQFPRAPGDIGNARSYNFPVRYKTVRNALTTRIMGHSPDPELIQPFVDAARELEAEGVKAITTSCGFLAQFQNVLAEAVSIPVFSSALLQVPLASVMFGRRRPIGVFTERAEYMNEAHFNAVGWSTEDFPVYIKGMKPHYQFPNTFIGNQNEADIDLLKREMVEMAQEFIEECPEAGAVVFECTNFCPFTSHVQEAINRPVFDINTLINWVHLAVEPRKFVP
jgi:hypothetical protein